MQDDNYDDTPFPEPVVIEITDVLDLHTIPPRQVRAVVEEYLREAQLKGFSVVRIIHGKGIGVQREVVRAVLSRIASYLVLRHLSIFAELSRDAVCRTGSVSLSTAFSLHRTVK